MFGKIIAIILIVILLGAAAWYFLLFPEELTQENLTASYNTHQKAISTISSYLTDYKVKTDITDFISADNRFMVPNMNEKQY